MAIPKKFPKRSERIHRFYDIISVGKKCCTMSYEKSTAELLEDAKKGIRPSKKNQIPDLASYLDQLLEKYNLNQKQIANETAISKSQLYPFTNSADPSLPSRNQLISIMFVIGASLEETQNALNYATKFFPHVPD